MGNPVVHFEIAGRDGQAMREFYEHLFDWQLGPDDGSGRCPVDTGGEGRIQGSLHHERHGPIETLIYVQVPDLQSALDSAEELGGKTILPPTARGDTQRIAQFEDPEGNIIGLIEG